jgi:hypothetical protein
VGFECTEEASALVKNDRILVADNTRPETQDGYVVSQDGLEIEVSQPITFEVGETYTIFLQLYDGTVESMPVTRVSNYVLTLSRAPRLDLVLGSEYVTQTLFTVIKDSSDRQTAFLLSEKSSKTNATFSITAINYSSLVYQQDKLLLHLLQQMAHT